MTHFGEAKTALFPAWSPNGKLMSVNIARGHPFILDLAAAWDEHNLRLLPPLDERSSFQAWSWSPDGRWIAGSKAQGGGVVIYSVEQRRYESITAFGSMPMWLSDNRRLIFAFQDRLFLVDRVTKLPAQLISFDGRIQAVAGGGFSITG